jgi:hypothetical protein
VTTVASSVASPIIVAAAVRRPAPSSTGGQGRPRAGDAGGGTRRSFGAHRAPQRNRAISSTAKAPGVTCRRNIVPFGSVGRRPVCGVRADTEHTREIMASGASPVRVVIFVPLLAVR